MPISQYDRLLGGPGSANKLMDALVEEYGAKEGRSIFYAKVENARKGKKERPAKKGALRRELDKRKRRVRSS